ncbi:DUF4145 domain-containing protein [Mesorhizobium sp. LSHC412B00]|uniref:DUF4145 domain-containing protein n=1 Tax=Mesorhizobium sp. LSHC412B00 TaxID=1287285 RepID=UPI0003CEACB1|nr:DUF4145 domain-containing protein [Mesorhizobium sp. LSHC412B00]ESX86899.1 hypothetical protein X756_17145 [Mesorhizobium sp. LSHC412B00]
MALLREDCPRCGTRNSTFDVAGQNSRGIVEANWVERFELFSICRHCHTGTIFVAENKTYDLREEIQAPGALLKKHGYLNDFMTTGRYISLRDRQIDPAPEFTPDDISAVFLEGATCGSVECWNAAGTMFRSVIDLATKSLLPPADNPEPSKGIRRSLGLRLQWLFDNKLLPVELQELAEAVQQDGNDGAHDGTLTKADALDLQDFTQQLLTRLYTVPGRIRVAKERREARRTGGG